MQSDLQKLRQPATAPQDEADSAVKVAGRSTFLAALVILLLFLVFVLYNFQRVTVSGESMAPTFRNKERVLVCKALWLVGPLKRGDVVVIRADVAGEYLIKRVHRLGGELVDDYSRQPNRWDFSNQGKYRVPPGHIYVIGDNLDMSEDSRSFGPVDVSAVIGKVWGE